MYGTLLLLNFPFDFIHKRENTYGDDCICNSTRTESTANDTMDPENLIEISLTSRAIHYFT